MENEIYLKEALPHPEYLAGGTTRLGPVWPRFIGAPPIPSVVSILPNFSRHETRA